MERRKGASVAAGAKIGTDSFGATRILAAGKDDEAQNTRLLVLLYSFLLLFLFFVSKATTLPGGNRRLRDPLLPMLALFNRSFPFMQRDEPPAGP